MFAGKDRQKGFYREKKGAAGKIYYWNWVNGRDKMIEAEACPNHIRQLAGRTYPLDASARNMGLCQE